MCFFFSCCLHSVEAGLCVFLCRGCKKPFSSPVNQATILQWKPGSGFWLPHNEGSRAAVGRGRRRRPTVPPLFNSASVFPGFIPEPIGRSGRSSAARNSLRSPSSVLKHTDFKRCYLAATSLKNYKYTHRGFKTLNLRLFKTMSKEKLSPREMRGNKVPVLLTLPHNWK